MIDEVADVAEDTSVDGEEELRVKDKVEVQQVSHSVGIIHPATPLSLLVRYHLLDQGNKFSKHCDLKSALSHYGWLGG